MSGEIDYSQYETDASETVGSEDILAQITRAVRELGVARSDVTAAEAALKATQDRVRQIEEFRLPELMREAGQTLLKTIDGETVELTETLHASIPAVNLPMALKWLMEHNQGSIIKRDIRLQFGKNEDEKADAALALILESGLTPQDKQSVHPQTLAAVLREMIAEGVDVPMELLGAHVRSFAKVKPPKR
jgi:multidrug efflux pump subunit AcrA (membrane-fusion protein)